MIMKSLVLYYEALARQSKAPPPGWCRENVSFALNISETGELLNVVPLLSEVTMGKKTVELPQRKEVPERVVRSSGVASNFLCDHAGYLLCIDSKGKPDRTLKMFEDCKKLHQEVLEEAQCPEALAVLRFFEKWQPLQAREYPVLLPYLEYLDAGANLVLQVEGRELTVLSEIRQAWKEYGAHHQSTLCRRCLISGEVSPIAPLHGKVKGVKGAQSVGANLISINAEAFESYGQCKDMPGAPVGEYAAFAYVTALNHLLAGRENKQQLGDTTVLFWADDAEEKMEQTFSFGLFPTPDTEPLLKALFERLAEGKMTGDIALEKPFTILGLAPNAARLSVRFFLQGQFGSFLRNMQAHYERLDIVRAPHEAEYLSPWNLLNETVNTKSKDKAPSPLLISGLASAILLGTPYPYGLYQAVLLRIRCEQDDKERHTKKVTRGRAALIKACLSQVLANQEEREVLTVALNEQTSNPAYLLGRLFSVLEQAQQAANPEKELNTTIKDRFFNSACATPATVFPQLIKLSRAHIAKSKYGYTYERQMAEILDRLPAEGSGFLTHLSLNEQGLFILGYYQQNQARYHKKEEE